MQGLPLAGIRVIDFSHSWAAPHCARLLADFGAEVIKVEYPGRLCILRGAKKTDRNYDNQPGWHQVNRNKLGITLDLNIDRHREILRDLIRIADVFVENSRTGVLERLGFGYGDLVTIKKDVIMLSMSAFGHSGPFSGFVGYGAVFEAVSGIQSLTAYTAGARPQRIRELDVTNGVAGAGAVMTALLHRQMTGQGQHIDLSQLEAATHAAIGEHLLQYAINGTQAAPTGNRHHHYAPQGCYRCRGEDQWVAITVRTQEEWTRFCHLAGHPEWTDDCRFADCKQRRENHDVLDALIETWTMERENHDIMHLLQKEHIPAGAVLDMAGLSRDPDLQQRRYFTSSQDGKKFMGMPFQLSGADGKVRWGGPNLGEHNAYVVSSLLGRPAGEIAPPEEEGIGTAFDVE